LIAGSPEMPDALARKPITFEQYRCHSRYPLYQQGFLVLREDVGGNNIRAYGNNFAVSYAA